MSEPTPDPRLDAVLERLADEASSEGPDGEDARLDALRAAVQADTGLGARLQSLSTPVRVGVLVAVVLLVAGAVAILNPRPDLALYPRLRLLFEAALPGVLALVLGSVGLRGAHRPAPGRGMVLGLVLISVLVPVFSALAPPADMMLPGAKGQGAFGKEALACFLYGAAAALPTGLVLRALHRGPPPGPARFALLGLGGALAGVLALQLHCPIARPEHLMLSHALIPVVALVVVFLLTRGGASRGRTK